MTSTHVYDPSEGAALPELPPLPIGVLAVATVNLLQEAADLPQPRYITIHDTQAIGVQFAPVKASIRAVTRWSLRFGGAVISTPLQDESGPQTYCRTEFSYYGVDVTVYALIPATTAAT